MSLFGNAVMRLMREGWTGPRQLAEEIFAILSTVDLPISTSGGISSTANDPGFAPYEANIPDDGGIVLNIKRKNQPDLPLSITPDGGLDFGGKPVGQGQTGSGGGTTVTSAKVKSGTGTNYLITLPAGNAVVATCIGIAATETVPAGTPILAFKPSAGGYFFQVPVWLGN